MPNRHTQALLDEVRAPKHADRKAGESAVLKFLPVLTRLSQQATEELALTQLADLAEHDEELRGRLDLYRQAAGTQLRICGEIERHIRDLVTTLRQRERYDAEVRRDAQRKGYATGLPDAAPESDPVEVLPISAAPPPVVTPPDEEPAPAPAPAPSKKP